MQHRKNIVRTAVVALLAAFAVVGPGAGPALAGDGDVAWTVRTASNSYGADRSSFSYAVNPGGQVKDAMVVANRGKAPVNLTVYAGDGYTTGTGQLDLLTKDKKSVGIGAWLRADNGTVALEPGQTADIPFTISVPDNATPGDYAGGIVTSLTQPDAKQSINVERRLGIRVKLRVGGDLKPGLAIEDLHVTYTGDAVVTYTIHNTGNAILSADQAVSIAGPFGWARADAGKIAAPPDLLPGETWKVSTTIKGVARTGWLTVTATLTPRLADASGSTTSLPAVRAEAHAWAVPWMWLLIVVVVIALAVGAFFLLRRVRARGKEREDARVREAVEKALRDEKAKAN
ncbi:WxL protein peptidoglycan domain-containing protein [Dactylosporangium sp. NPDC048998]|uniref:COG1470 family protein n=1 Tax=Dactylosporangium sp. NPDC048998 TaxID=3363976 RepID=UPI0037132EE6